MNIIHKFSTMKRFLTIASIAIFTLSITGCNWFQSTQPTDDQSVNGNTTTEQQEVVNEDTENAVATLEIADDNTNDDTDEQNSEQNNEQNEDLQFETIDEYVALIMDETTKTQYEVDEPSGLERVSFGDVDGLDVAPDGVTTNVYVLTASGWGTGSMETVRTFYLEQVSPSPCWTEPDCDEPNEVNYYGPFKGKLALLVQ